MPGKQDPEFSAMNDFVSTLYKKGMPLLSVTSPQDPSSNPPMALPFELDDDSASLSSMPDSTCSEDQIELEMDVDKLVLNIREKLRMGNHKLFAQAQAAYSLEYSPESSSSEYSSYIHSPRISRGRRSTPYTTGKKGKRPSSSQGGGYQQPNNSWQEKSCLSSKSFNDVRRQQPPSPSSDPDDPYKLLQELLESGSLIKEAVRRLNRHNRKSSLLSPTPSTSSGPGPCPGPNPPLKKCPYLGEDTENYPNSIPMSAP